MNNFIASLPADARAVLQAGLREVELKKGQVLHRIDEPVENVYFPHQGLVSLMVLMKSGEFADVALIGRDGIVCSGVALDAQDAIDQATVELSGNASCMSSISFIHAYQSNHALRISVNRHQALHLAEGRQLTACNGIHHAKRRFCRWLAHAFDQTGKEEVQLTQQFLARMVAVGRPTINVICGDLRAEGIIEISRGQIKIVKIEKLRDRACECYGILKNRSAKIFQEVRRKSRKIA